MNTNIKNVIEAHPFGRKDVFSLHYTIIETMSSPITSAENQEIGYRKLNPNGKELFMLNIKSSICGVGGWKIF